jgi:hypothetical protein
MPTLGPPRPGDASTSKDHRRAASAPRFKGAVRFGASEEGGVIASLAFVAWISTETTMQEAR